MAAALNLVLVEDHDALRELLVAHLASRGHRVRAAASAEALDDELAHARPDLYLLDVRLPGEDGLSLARRLRAAEPEAGVVLISCLDALPDRLAGYRHGADAYLPKPIDVDELDAVIAAVARRRAATATAAMLRLRCNLQRLVGPRGEVPLSSAEAALMRGLARAPERTLESWQLIALLGESTERYRKASLEVRIVRLRRKLVSVGIDGDCLAGVRGHGYRLRLPLIVTD